jgi:hypothetical protein
MEVMNKDQTLNNFWNSFDIPAFDENTVPDNTIFPYITYEMSSDNFGNVLVQTASLWYRDSSWTAITNKSQEIADFITRGGRMLTYDGGALWIQKASPWAQRLDDPSDDMIRRIVLNVIVEFLD